MGDSGDTNVRVAVRCRPLSSKELGNGESSIIKIDKNAEKLVITDPSSSGEPHSFGFDLLFDGDSEQQSVWEAIGEPIMDKAFSGFNGTIFAYGQTGSGKTWSMQGLPSDAALRGIIPRMNQSLFEQIATNKAASPTTAFLVTVSYFELYNEVIFDLLDPSPRSKRPKGGLEIKEHPALGVYIKGIQEVVVENAKKLQSIVDKGMSSRTVASTAMNADSSRSHSVFVIKIHQKDDTDELKNIFAKINLVDLAGSERVKSTGAQGATLKEGANINKSLSALGNVINALVEQAKAKEGSRKVFVPYRNSKLTRVLQESLGGNSVTAMLAALSPAACNFEETLSTLKYANRAKAIKVKAVKNEEASQISKLNDEIRQLKEQLAAGAARAAEENQAFGGGKGEDGKAEVEERHKRQLRELEDAMRNDWKAKARESEKYEHERQRLATEQKNTAKKLLEERNRQWTSLEASDDIKLTLKHIRQLVMASVENGHADVSMQSYANSMSGWAKQLEQVDALELSSKEQFTVLQIFSRSLIKDCTALSTAASGRSTSSPTKAPVPIFDHGPGRSSTDAVCDRSTVSLWKQLRDRLNTVDSELGKWTPLQDSLNATLDLLHREVLSCVQRCEAEDHADDNVQSSAEISTEDGSGLDRKEFRRGMNLFLKQVKSKVTATSKAIEEARISAIDIVWLQEKLTVLLGAYRDVTYKIEQFSKSDPSGGGDPAMNESTDAAIIDELIKEYSNIEAILESLTRTQASSTRGDDAGAVRLLAAGKCSLCCSSGSALGSEVDSGCLDGKSGWIASPYQTSESNLQMKLPRSASVSAVHIQGAWGCPVEAAAAAAASQTTTTIDSKDAESSLHGHLVQSGSYPALVAPSFLSPRRAETLQRHLSDVRLPSVEFNLLNLTGEPTDTASALSVVMEWSSLLKRQDPLKFLKRPPVRFLFDLFKHLATKVAVRMDDDGVEKTLFPVQIRESTWEETSKDKASKIQYMRHCIQFIATCIGKPDSVITTASSIVTGSNSNLTNMLLQQTAIVVYAFVKKLTCELDDLSELNGLEISPGTFAQEKKDAAVKLMSQSAPMSTTTTTAKSHLHVNAVTPVWPTRVRISLSKNGTDWVPSSSNPGTCNVQEFHVDLHNWTDISVIQLEAVEFKTSYVRITPLAWQTENASITTDHDKSNEQVLPSLRVGLSIHRKPSNALPGISTSPRCLKQHSSGQSIREALSIFQRCLRVPVRTIEIAIRLSEKRKQKKMNERIQQMADANEGERAAWAAERKELYEQLSRSEEEKKQIQSENEILIESSLATNQEFLQLQADYSKCAASLEQVNNQIQQLVSENVKLSAKCTQMQSTADKLDADREDIQGELAVMREERDAARENEEDLFERLEDVSKDLEELQQSYIDTTERCNDAVDELMDARDTIAQMQENRAAINLPTSDFEDKQKIKELEAKVKDIDASSLKERQKMTTQIIVIKEQLLDAQREIKTLKYENARMRIDADNAVQEIQDRKLAEAEMLIQKAGAINYSSSPAAESKIDSSPRSYEQEEAALGIYTHVDTSNSAFSDLNPSNVRTEGPVISRQYSDESFTSYADDFDNEEGMQIKTAGDAIDNGASAAVVTAITGDDDGYGDDDFEDDFED